MRINNQLSFFFFLILHDIESCAAISFDSKSFHGYVDFHPLKNEAKLKVINGEIVKLMMDRDRKTPVSCTRECGQNGFCFFSLCYIFPFEKYQISSGSLVTDEMGRLEGCTDNCRGGGLYCQKDIFGTGICLSAEPVCKFISNYTISKCIDSQICYEKLSEGTSGEYFRKYKTGAHCVKAGISEKICCQEDPETLKCPDNVLPLLSQPECFSNCTGLCYQGFCCPDRFEINGVTRYGASSFIQNISCIPNEYPKQLVPMSGCVNGTVVLFGRDNIELRRTERICKVLLTGEFYNGCIANNETCMHLESDKFICVKTIFRKGIDFSIDIKEWFWMQMTVVAFICFIAFWTVLFSFRAKSQD